MMLELVAALGMPTMQGALLVLSIVVPVVGVLLAFVAGGRRAEQIAVAIMPFGLAIAIAVFVAFRLTGAPLIYLLGGWSPPLGVALRADGLSVVMMLITAVVICCVGIFARADFGTPNDLVEARAPFSFWTLLLAVWGALNTVFVSGDLFTLYVALELLTFAAVPLVSLDGRAETLQAALRYLLFALLGSLLYLVGTTLLYGAYGTLDITLLSYRVHASPILIVAAALMTVGLLAKTALFPLHLWLPPAHAGAPAAASAVLSALVVKGSFFIVVRLWFDVMPALPGPIAANLLAALGAAGILFGSVVALRQQRLKLLIAYSTLAQIGYLFLMFPLAFDPVRAHLHNGALAGGMVQAMSHATAKAAMFMAAGLIYAALGHDRIDGLAGVARRMPMSVLTFALAGIALIGLPPSGAYLAKSLLLHVATETRQWWWAVVIQVGGIFTSSYVLLVLVHTMAPAGKPVAPRVPIRRSCEAAALILASGSLLLGLIPWHAYLPAPYEIVWKPRSLEAISSALGLILSGGLLAILMGRSEVRFASIPDLIAGVFRPIRRAAVACALTLVRVDGTLRQWSAAGLFLLVIVIMFIAAMLEGR